MTPRTDRLRVLSALHAAALTARLGQLDDVRLTTISTLADALPPHDPVRGVVTEFQSTVAISRRNRPALATAGEELLRNVLRQLRAAPVDIGRMDIHG